MLRRRVVSFNSNSPAVRVATGGELQWILMTLPLALVVGAIPVGLLAAFGGLDHATDQRLAAVLAMVGVLVTAVVSWSGMLVRVQAENRLKREHADEQARLRLDAAMRAGELLSTNDDRSPQPAAVASGLLALPQLGRADLAVALLVDLWDVKGSDDTPDISSSPAHVVSAEIAILVLDAALQDDRPSAQLVAAELLCRNAQRLDLCQSLHWPASIDGTWNSSFGVKTKVLIVEGLVRMACASAPNQNALQSLAVRLYGISVGDADPHVKGCVGMLLTAIVPALQRLGTASLMQGPSEVTMQDIETAASQAHANPDRVFYRIAKHRSAELETWAGLCHETDFRPGAMAASM
jgi:hypothetical protein